MEEELQGERDGREKNSSNKDSGENKEWKHFKVSTAAKKKNNKSRKSVILQRLTISSPQPQRERRVHPERQHKVQLITSLSPLKPHTKKNLLSWRNSQQKLSDMLFVYIRLLIVKIFPSKHLGTWDGSNMSVDPIDLYMRTKTKQTLSWLGKKKKSADVTWADEEKNTLVQSNNRRQKFDCFSYKEMKIVIEFKKLRVKMATKWPLLTCHQSTILHL